MRFHANANHIGHMIGYQDLEVLVHVSHAINCRVHTERKAGAGHMKL